MGILREHLDLAALRREVETHPHMRKLAGALERRGLRPGEANRLLEGIFLRVIEDAGELYSGTMRGHLERMAHLRDRVSSLVESIVNGTEGPHALPGENTETIFADLQHELDALESPGDHLEHEGVQVRDDVVARARAESELRPFTPEQQRVQREILQDLDATGRARANLAAERAPADTRRAVFAESAEGRTRALNEVRARLRAAGVNPEEIDATLEALMGLNRRFREAQRDPVTLQGATNILTRMGGVVDLNALAAKAQADLHDPAILGGPPEVLARARALARLSDPALQKAMIRSHLLQRLAGENPQALGELWGKYQESGSKGTLHDYTLGIMQRHVVGLRGELTATFGLGEGLTLLKSPDLKVTIPGTDMVGVADLTGDVWLVDNKAWSADQLGTVDSLTRNLPGNIADDVAEIQQALAGPTHQGRALDPHIQNAVERLGRASKEIQEITAGLTPEQVEEPGVQREIARVLNRYRIRRVVTNAGGQISRISARLKEIGVDLEDLR